MTTDDHTAQITALACEHFGSHNPDSIDRTKTFTEQFDADSLDLVEWIMLLEEEFEIEISDDQAVKVVGLQASIDIVQKLVPS